VIYIHSWSGGKDSTASIILDHIHGLPPSKIIMSEVMFDKSRGISGELPEHMEWVHNKAIPLFQRWGYEVEILRAKKDYLDLFYHVIEKSKHKERIGKYAGFPIAGMCAINRYCKVKPITDYYKNVNEVYTQYVGIAIDEPIRLKRLKGTNKVSLLERYRYTEKMSYELDKQYDLLSPIYGFTKRGGCWFCPNAKYAEFAYIKKTHPKLWDELEKLSVVDNLVSPCFKYGETLGEVDKKIDAIINQITFDEVWDG